jgi:hypothetical protein
MRDAKTAGHGQAADERNAHAACSTTMPAARTRDSTCAPPWTYHTSPDTAVPLRRPLVENLSAT